MDRLQYLKDCLQEAAHDCDLTISEEQLTYLSEEMDASFNLFGFYSGGDVADSNHISDAELELSELRVLNEKHRIWELNTKPCKVCTTTGVVNDGWGRKVNCLVCNGKGRH